MEYREIIFFSKLKIIIGLSNLNVHSCWRIHFVVLSDLIPKYKMIQTSFKMVFKICFEVGFEIEKKKRKEEKENPPSPIFFWPSPPAAQLPSLVGLAHQRAAFPSSPSPSRSFGPAPTRPSARTRPKPAMRTHASLPLPFLSLMRGPRTLSH